MLHLIGGERERCSLPLPLRLPLPRAGARRACRLLLGPLAQCPLTKRRRPAKTHSQHLAASQSLPWPAPSKAQAQLSPHRTLERARGRCTKAGYSHLRLGVI